MPNKMAFTLTASTYALLELSVFRFADVEDRDFLEREFGTQPLREAVRDPDLLAHAADEGVI